jgi:hypothetical protein
MARGAESLREQASRLFALALKARERGHVEQAESLIAAASRCIDQAIETEAAAARAAGVAPRQAPQPPPAADPSPVQQQQQQQQEQQPPPKDDSNSRE